MAASAPTIATAAARTQIEAERKTSSRETLYRATVTQGRMTHSAASRGQPCSPSRTNTPPALATAPAPCATAKRSQASGALVRPGERPAAVELVAVDARRRRRRAPTPRGRAAQRDEQRERRERDQRVVTPTTQKRTMRGASARSLHQPHELVVVREARRQPRREVAEVSAGSRAAAAGRRSTARRSRRARAARARAGARRAMNGSAHTRYHGITQGSARTAAKSTTPIAVERPARRRTATAAVPERRDREDRRRGHTERTAGSAPPWPAARPSRFGTLSGVTSVPWVREVRQRAAVDDAARRDPRRAAATAAPAIARGRWRAPSTTMPTTIANDGLMPAAATTSAPAAGSTQRGRGASRPRTRHHAAATRHSTAGTSLCRPPTSAIKQQRAEAEAGDRARARHAEPRRQRADQRDGRHAAAEHDRPSTPTASRGPERHQRLGQQREQRAVRAAQVVPVGERVGGVARRGDGSARYGFSPCRAAIRP